MEDEEIIAKILAGERENYDSLVRKYQDKVFRLCCSMLHERTRAEDAAQEIFIKVYHSLARFQKASSFSTWLYRIAANHCLDLLRKESRRRTESWEALVEESGEKIHELFSSSENSKNAFENAELVQEVLSRLSPEQKTILLLREVEGLSYREIAEVLGCSLDSVKSRLKRSREGFEEKLRHFLKEENV